MFKYYIPATQCYQTSSPYNYSSICMRLEKIDCVIQCDVSYNKWISHSAMLVVIVVAYDDVTGRHEEELVRVAGVGDEEAPGPADGWAVLGRDWETDGSGAGLDDAGGGKEGGNRLL
jgi:hypothetical protein